MDVSIIIVNYNTRDLLKDCILSVQEKTQDVDYEIIVVDNDSHDGSVDMLKEEFPTVRTIESGGNLGFGRANNVGMKAASGKYLFLLNSDTLLINNAVKEFYDNAESLSKSYMRTPILGSILKNKSLGTCNSYGKFPTPLHELRNVTAKYLRFMKDPMLLSPKEVNEPKPVDFITGADMFLPRIAFEESGGFDPDFFMYGEEVDWQKRLSDLGYVRLIVNGPEIIHLEGGSDSSKSKTWSARRLGNLYRSRRLYRRKHYGKIGSLLFTSVYRIMDAPSLIITAILQKDAAYLKLL